MFSVSIRPILRFRFLPLVLLTLLIIEQGLAARPASAANQAPFRIMVPLMLMSAPAPLPEATPEQQVLELTNSLRQQHGCPALQMSPELINAAQAHSQDMANYNYFAHVDRSGHTPKWRAQQAGYLGNAGTENIAAGFSTAQEVVMAWYNETPPNDGHRRNLLNCSLTDLGIGYAINPSSNYRNYWTQDFGQR
jgi:uncharacterized protein YkwD